MPPVKVRKKNEEFAKWWNGWVSRIQRRDRQETVTRQPTAEDVREKVGKPFTLQLLEKLTYPCDL